MDEQPTVQSAGSEGFNFMEAEEAGPKIVKEDKTTNKSALDILMETEEDEVSEVDPVKEIVIDKEPVKKEGTRKSRVMAILAETRKSGKDEKEAKVIAKKIATSGSLTPEVIKEARALAGSKKGLDIAVFTKKYNLVNFNVDHVLTGKLDAKGNLL